MAHRFLRPVIAQGPVDGSKEQAESSTEGLRRKTVKTQHFQAKNHVPRRPQRSENRPRLVVNRNPLKIFPVDRAGTSSAIAMRQSLIDVVIAARPRPHERFVEAPAIAPMRQLATGALCPIGEICPAGRLSQCLQPAASSPVTSPICFSFR